MSTPSETKQTLITIRHALRIDEVDGGQWAFSAERPWDPPLSSEGSEQVRSVRYSHTAGCRCRVREPTAEHLRQAKVVAKRFPQVKLQHIVCSPFLRCLQTAAAIHKCLPEPKPTVEIDPSLCEVRLDWR